MFKDGFFQNKRVLVIGGCGTVGKELINQLLKVYGVGELVVLDNNESELFLIEQEYSEYNNLSCFLGDIRDERSIARKAKSIDIIFLAAAFKHVSLCEQVPFEAVNTNILGVENVIRAAVKGGAENLIFTSSDKAVNPTNVMGTSKLMGERLITAANVEYKDSGCIFASTRFGNVLGSRGSVVPLFVDQIKKRQEVTLTHEQMTRFVMSAAQSVQLIIDSAKIVKGGEVLVTKMPVVRIIDLAKALFEIISPEAEKKIKIIGVKPGEKLYEELMTGEETNRSIELERYFVIKPAIMNRFTSIQYTYKNVLNDVVTNPYNSSFEDFMNINEIISFLEEQKVL